MQLAGRMAAGGGGEQADWRFDNLNVPAFFGILHGLLWHLCVGQAWQAA